MMLRSPLFVPGNKANMLEKALTVAPDALVPDMEDSVPAAEKANARNTIATLLPRLAASGRPVIPRVNALETDWIEADLAAEAPLAVLLAAAREDLAADVEVRRAAEPRRLLGVGQRERDAADTVEQVGFGHAGSLPLRDAGR